MEQHFGHTVKFTFSRSRTWLSPGPGWAAIAGALSSGYLDLSVSTLLQLVSLWLLVDPILGTLWDLAVRQRLWRRITRARLPLPPTRGFILPYAQPGSIAGHVVLLIRRYRLWWAQSYWPVFGGEVITFGVGLVLALLLGLVYNSTLFWLVVLTISLTILAGLSSSDLSKSGGGRLQSIVQFLLPWSIGAFIWPPVTFLPLVLGLCYWLVYLGGLRMLGSHRRAETLFFLGQVAVILLLLAFRLLPGATILSVLLFTQLLIKIKFSQPADFLRKVQVYLVLGLVVAGLSVGIVL